MKKSLEEKEAPESTPKDLHELEHDELSGHETQEKSLSATSTDEDENEGLGNGKMGKSVEDILGK